MKQHLALIVFVIGITDSAAADQLSLVASRERIRVVQRTWDKNGDGKDVKSGRILGGVVRELKPNISRGIQRGTQQIGK